MKDENIIINTHLFINQICIIIDLISIFKFKLHFLKVLIKK